MLSFPSTPEYILALCRYLAQSDPRIGKEAIGVNTDDYVTLIDLRQFSIDHLPRTHLVTEGIELRNLTPNSSHSELLFPPNSPARKSVDLPVPHHLCEVPNTSTVIVVVLKYGLHVQCIVDVLVSIATDLMDWPTSCERVREVC